MKKLIITLAIMAITSTANAQGTLQINDITSFHPDLITFNLVFRDITSGLDTPPPIPITGENLEWAWLNLQNDRDYVLDIHYNIPADLKTVILILQILTGSR